MMFCRKHKVNVGEDSYCVNIWLKYHILHDYEIIQKNNILICKNCLWSE